MMWWHGNLNGWEWLAMAASMVAFWGLVIWAVLSVVGRGGPSGRSAPSDPEQILRERFARGEIDADDYERRRELMRR